MNTMYGKDAQKEIVASYADFESLGEDEEAKCNHLTCEAGTDVKGRFNIKHVDGAYLFHCYHCGLSGCYRPREILRKMGADMHKSEAKAHSPARDSYLHAEMDFDKFSLESKMWLDSYHFDADMVHKYGIRYMDGRTLLPVFARFPIVMSGYQERAHINNVPKYLTTYYVSRTLAHFDTGSDTVYFVEDLLSAYRLHHAGASVVCLLGTKPPPFDHVEAFTKRPKRAVLWLDPDLAGKVGSKELFTQLVTVYPHIVNLTVSAVRQPKEVGIYELKEIINNVRS